MKERKKHCEHIYEAKRSSMKNSRLLNPKNVQIQSQKSKS